MLILVWFGFRDCKYTVYPIALWDIVRAVLFVFAVVGSTRFH